MPPSPPHRPTIFAADTLALALFNAEQYAEAAEYSQKARATGSQDAAILFHAGSIQRALGNVSEARKLFDEARKSNADFSVLGSAKLQAALQEAKRSK
jgi:tetratricopeptide (TPR) repeat protein